MKTKTNSQLFYKKTTVTVPPLKCAKEKQNCMADYTFAEAQLPIHNSSYFFFCFSLISHLSYVVNATRELSFKTESHSFGEVTQSIQPHLTFHTKRSLRYSGDIYSFVFLFTSGYLNEIQRFFIASWEMCAYDCYSRVQKYQKTSECVF